MKVVTFEPQHLSWVMNYDDHALKEQLGNISEVAARCKEKGPAITIVSEEVAVACAGFSMIFKRSAEAWMMIAQNKAGPHLMREIRSEMNRWIVECKLVRLQATSPSNSEILPRMYKWLGMQYEGTLRRFGPNGEDYLMYAWVEKCQ